MNSPFLDCSCQRATRTEDKSLLDDFRRIWKCCPALRTVLVPETIWPEFEEACNENLNSARHRSILLLALKRGYLNQITSSVHRYLLEDNKPKNKMTKQYRQDLQERWLRENDEIERHQKSKMFMGKLCELQCAEWIEEQGWNITNLEAWGGSQDIEALAPDGTEHSIEVKYIGQEDTDFLALVNSLAGESQVRPVSLYLPCNFMLFRVYEAAKQLKRSSKVRFAMLVISDITWERFDLQLKNDWIDWELPSFFNNDIDWKKFLQKAKRRYPQIQEDLKPTIDSLKQLWIVKMCGFKLSLEKNLLLDGAP